MPRNSEYGAKRYTYPTVPVCTTVAFGEALEWTVHPVASYICRGLGGGGGPEAALWGQGMEGCLT